MRNFQIPIVCVFRVFGGLSKSHPGETGHASQKKLCQSVEQAENQKKAHAGHGLETLWEMSASMNKERNANGMSRRQFLQTSAEFAASAVFLSLGSAQSFAAPNASTRKNLIPLVTLNNGLQMPRLGLGTMTLNGDVGIRCVADAISLGYRLIDTAMIYGTETAVGDGIKQSGIKREELFITSKLWKADMGYEQAKKGFQTSIDKLGTDYLDLYLIHRPAGDDWKGSWKAMEELYHEGKIKAIGVSNFDFAQLDDLMASSDVKPAIHQIETHAFFQEGKSLELLKATRRATWKPGHLLRKAVMGFSPMPLLQPSERSTIRPLRRCACDGISKEELLPSPDPPRKRISRKT